MINRICTHKNKLIIIRESLFVGLKITKNYSVKLYIYQTLINDDYSHLMTRLFI